MVLKRYKDTVILSYDSDAAGTKAALKAIDLLKEVGLKGKVLDLRAYKDLDEFIKNEGKEAFEERVRNAENTFFFEIRVLYDSYDMSDPVSKTEFQRELAAKLCRFEEALERENYIEAVAAKYNIPLEDLRKLVTATAARGVPQKALEKPKSGIQAKKSPEEGSRKNQRLLLTWLTDEPQIFSKVTRWIGPEDLLTICTGPWQKSCLKEWHRVTFHRQQCLISSPIWRNTGR